MMANGQLQGALVGFDRIAQQLRLLVQPAFEVGQGQRSPQAILSIATNSIQDGLTHRFGEPGMPPVSIGQEDCAVYGMTDDHGEDETAL
jgi:hypothetical protein